MRSALLALAGSGCVAALHVTATATVTTDSIAPPFALIAADDQPRSLASELAHGPVVLVFYRGYW